MQLGRAVTTSLGLRLKPFDGTIIASKIVPEPGDWEV